MGRIKVILIVFSLFIAIFAAYYLSTKTSKEIVADETKEQQYAIKLRFGHNIPVDSALHQASARFAKEVNRKTNGRVSIDVYPAQQLGNDHHMVEMARKGELDILLTPTAKMSVAVPSIQYADIPFYFPTRQDVYDMLDGEPGKMIFDDMKKIGLIGVTFWENGFKHITANFPVLSPDDLKGKKFRVMKSRIIMEQFESFGATPIPIDFHSTKKALADKVVDGQENPLVAISSMGFYKEQTDLTLSEHAFLGYVLSFSQKSFSKLPNNIQNIMIETAKEITPWEREETQKREEKLLQKIKDYGVRVHTLNNEQRQQFSKLVKHIPKQFEDIIGPAIISKTDELLYDKYGAFLKNKDHILIGVDADLSLGGKIAGLEIKRGVELALKEINENGGVLGKPLVVIARDHRVMGTQGVGNVEKFGANPNLAAIIGGKHSAVIADEIDTINSLKIPYLIPWAVVDKLVDNGYKDNYIFRLSANDRYASKYIAEYAMKKYKKPVVIAENSIWGRESLKTIKKYLPKQGKEQIVEFFYNRGQRDFKNEISDIIESGADCIIMTANALEGSHIIKELSRSNRTLPVISHWGIIGGDFYDKTKNDLNIVDLKFFQTFVFNKNSNSKAKNLLELYKNTYKAKNVKIGFAVAQAYDLTHILSKAIEKAGSLDKQKIKEALESITEYNGVIKNYKNPFTKNRHEGLNKNDYHMVKFDADGSVEFVD